MNIRDSIQSGQSKTRNAIGAGFITDKLEKAKGHPIGTINRYQEMKMPDGKWKYVGKQGHQHPAAQELKKQGHSISEVESTTSTPRVSISKPPEFTALPNRHKALERVRDLKQDLYQNGDHYSKEESSSKNREVRQILRDLKREAPTPVPGGTYSTNEFSDFLAWNGKNPDQPQKTFENKQEANRYNKLSDEEVSIIKKVAYYNPGIYNFLNRSGYSPTDIKLEKLGVEQEEVKSSNIHDIMAARSTTTYKGSFKIKLEYSKEPITIEREFSEDSTLSRRDINNFM